MGVHWAGWVGGGGWGMGGGGEYIAFQSSAKNKTSKLFTRFDRFLAFPLGPSLFSARDVGFLKIKLVTF